MFQSKVKPIQCKRPKTCIKKARQFCKQWFKESSGRKGKKRPFVRSKVLKDRRGRGWKVFLTRFWDHIRSKEKHDVARRVKLLPCVRDLLQNVEEKPSIKDNVYIFQGGTRGGEAFKVVIQEEQGQLYLVTFYPDRK